VIKPEKTITLLLCFSFLFAGEFFDDFSYKNPQDPALQEHNWTIVSGIDAPPANTTYLAENIRFDEDPDDSQNRIMHLLASCQSDRESFRLSRIQSDHIFFEGTYACRIHFDNAMAKTKDGNIQAFYTISPIMEINDSSYSECDFEYLPYDIWNSDGNTKPAYYLSTWEIYNSTPLINDYASDATKKKLKGWHLIVIQIADGKVSYYLDKNNKPVGTHSLSPLGSDVYPESHMQIAFANWISSHSEDKNKKRSSTMKVDWIYHVENEIVSLNEVYHRVRLMQKDEVKYLNTLNK
jgi:hypothetical protein